MSRPPALGGVDVFDGRAERSGDRDNYFCTISGAANDRGEVLGGATKKYLRGARPALKKAPVSAFSTCLSTVPFCRSWLCGAARTPERAVRHTPLGEINR